MARYVAIDAPRIVSVREEAVREPGPGEILVASILSGVSAGTEMALYRGELGNLRTKRWGYWTDYPIRPGYQLVGVVERCGESVGDVRPGDRVVCHAPHATHATVTYANYVRVPDRVSTGDATFAMLGATTAHGIRRAGAIAGDAVLVLGFGVVGWLSGDHARCASARQVLVADPAAWKRELAARRGYDAPLDPKRSDFEHEVAERTGGGGADLVIEASGSPLAIESALRAVRPGGRVLLMGTQVKPVEIDFSDYPMHKEVSFICTWGKGTLDSPPAAEAEATRRLPAGGPDTRKGNQQRAIDMIADGRLRVDGLVTDRFGFEEIGRVYESIDRGGLQYMQIVLEY